MPYRLLPPKPGHALAALARVAMLLLVVGAAWPPACGQRVPGLNPHPAWPDLQGSWAWQTFQNLTLEQKVGQLVVASVFTRPGRAENVAEAERWVRQLHLGGVIFMKGHPTRQALASNRLQSAANIPLLAMQDAEWGLAMRLDSTIRHPLPITLGALADDSLLYHLGLAMAHQCRAVGVHQNLAPVVDLNTNPANPVIGWRAFGDDKHAVARKASRFTQGLRAGQVMGAVKHFPGHGDTDKDSHLDLPALDQDLVKLFDRELYPFSQLIGSGSMAVMVGHLHVRALDSAATLPSSLSPKVVQGLLREALRFRGLILTDGLNMVGATQHLPPGQLEVAALQAGNDLLIGPVDVPKAVAAVVAAVRQGKLDSAELDRKVLRVLLAKEWLQLHRNALLNLDQLPQRLNSRAHRALNQRLYRQALTLLHAKPGALPLPPQPTPLPVLLLGQTPPDSGNPFLAQLARLGPTRPLRPTEGDAPPPLPAPAQPGQPMVVAWFSGRYPTPADSARWAPLRHALQQAADSGWAPLAVVFDVPYSPAVVQPAAACLLAYEPHPHAQEAAAQALMGALAAPGRAPLRVLRPSQAAPPLPDTLTLRDDTLAARLANPAAWQALDELLQRAVDQGATPGLVALAIHKGRVVYAQGFGEHAPNDPQPADPYRSVYDLASLTKVATTTLLAMHLAEVGRLNLDAPLSLYEPDWRDTPLGQATVRDLLSHTTGLRPGMATWHGTLTNGKPKPPLYSPEWTGVHRLALGPQLFLDRTFPDTLWGRLAAENLAAGKPYRYSDLNFLILGRLIERLTRTPLDHLADSLFYRPLGMNRTTFRPGQTRPDLPTPPTEAAQAFRPGPIQGYVHDELAALFGGVAGHAGLFSTAHDLGKLGTMLANGGTYAGRRYLQPATITQFGHQVALGTGHRGLGWNKPDYKGPSSQASRQAAPTTFGHWGFTGTAWWIDPTNQVVFVLLSNRTYPSRKPNGLYKLQVRRQAMDLVYQALNLRQP